MNKRPVHRIDITHRWQEREKAEPIGDSENVSVLECLDCGQSRRLLDLDVYDDSNEHDSSDGKILEEIVETRRKLSATTALLLAEDRKSKKRRRSDRIWAVHAVPWLFKMRFRTLIFSGKTADS